MNIHEVQLKNFGSDVHLTASTVAPEETSQLEARYQQLWDEGKYFSYQGMMFGGMMGKRTEDTPEEASACASQLQRDMEKLVEDAWLKSLSREEAVSLCNLLAKSGRLYPARIEICAGMRYDAEAIARNWSALHPDEETICVPSPDIG